MGLGSWLKKKAKKTVNSATSMAKNPLRAGLAIGTNGMSEVVREVGGSDVQDQLRLLSMSKGKTSGPAQTKIGRIVSRGKTLSSARASRANVGSLLTGEAGAAALIGEMNQLSLGQGNMESETSSYEDTWKKIRGSGQYKGKSTAALENIDSQSRALASNLKGLASTGLGKGMTAEKARESLLARKSYLKQKQSQPGRLQTLLSKTM